MAYLKTGVVANDPLGVQHVKSVLISAPGAASVVKIINPGSVIEMEVCAPAGSSSYVQQASAPSSVFHVSLGAVVTITGDANTFVRID